ncbi:MAG: UDP-Glc:alpha-D-GlcNAc-diphosphoundecaprenol beta-1,3-glucosyltransferase WfgD [candidate division BRC1 bacterium ADurb.BinA292]|nr:MAG: UDP-Glc:alpha-D-GlcNAc-diphosphoundecaprenol beta-1,3-glucosyltransferase WfgD [candidate division BRC1 bacterium ADurb.BinA292]
MDNPRVSIIIPVKNRAHLMSALVDSLVHQSFLSWEALVVDDGSEADELLKISQLCSRDARIRLIRREAGKSGAGACRNLGFRHARGEFIMFIDSDDCISTPDCLADRVEFLGQRGNLDFCVSPVEIFESVPGDLARLHNIVTAETDLIRFLKRDIPWQTAGPTWRRKTLDRLGPWNEDLPSWQDWEFHTRALLAGLSYERFPDGRAYWRLPSAAGSIGAAVRSVEHLKQVESLLIETAQRIDKNHSMDRKTRRALAFSFFFTAVDFIALDRPTDAHLLWRAFKQVSHAPQWEIAALELYSRVFKWPGISGACRCLLHLLLPPTDIPQYSTTFRRCGIEGTSTWNAAGDDSSHRL